MMFLKIKEACNLIPMDPNGLSDPYVKVNYITALNITASPEVSSRDFQICPKIFIKIFYGKFSEIFLIPPTPLKYLIASHCSAQSYQLQVKLSPENVSGNQKKKTKTIKGSLNPTWNETLKL